MSKQRLSTQYVAFLAMVLSVTFSGSAIAQQERHFNFWGSHGAFPSSGLTTDGQGNFYGMTFGGGSTTLGVVYEITPTFGGANQIVLYNFMGAGAGDGANPTGDLILDQTGNLYGVTQFGGASNMGTVFELSPPSQPGGPWTETVLHSFQGSPSDGAQPVAGLIFDDAGNLYGTTSLGGIQSAQCGCGAVFELSPPSQSGGGWTETMLYMFQGQPDGNEPMGGVVFDRAGNLYGTTSQGDKYYGGSVFQLTPPSSQGEAWTETVIHNFLRADGVAPMAGLVLSQGNALFGTGSGGGAFGFGTVFRLLPPQQPGGPWGFGVAHSFSSNLTDGSVPSAGLIFGNPYTLYGTTLKGGEFGCGIVFEITAPAGNLSYSVLYNFGLGDGCDPASRLTLDKYALYGTTGSGGYQDNGVAFSLAH